jgi:hypothetical protein
MFTVTHEQYTYQLNYYEQVFLQIAIKSKETKICPTGYYFIKHVLPKGYYFIMFFQKATTS